MVIIIFCKMIYPTWKRCSYKGT